MPVNSVFKPIKVKIEDIFSSEAKYTFLVGAGISMENPSGLASARELGTNMLKLCVPSEEVNGILQLENLRYEFIVELIQKYFDPELKIMNYFEQFKSPNILHLFLANATRNGSYVITTNFDYLIEYALIEIIGDKTQIVPVITRQDFINNSDPQLLLDDGKYPIFKLHGSKRNIITNEETANSVITTISALGRDREEGETFAIEPYKKPAVYNVLKDRTLVVMGYSGSDDFDIGPTLKELHGLSKLIWIDHSPKKELEISTIDIEKLDFDHPGQIDSLLAQMYLQSKKQDKTLEIYKININTAFLVENILWNLFFEAVEKPLLEEVTDSVDSAKWIQNVLVVENIGLKYMLASDLYFTLSQFNDSLRCSEKGVEMADQKNDQKLKMNFLNKIGLIYRDRGNFKDAMEHLNQALKIAEQLDDYDGKASNLCDIGMIYHDHQRYEEALERYEKALKMAEQNDDLPRKSTYLNNIAAIYYAQKKYQDALDYYKQSFKITEKQGDLTGKALRLNNIGMVYHGQYKYQEAIQYYNQALEISELLGDLFKKASYLNNIGMIHQDQKRYKDALEYYKQAYRILVSIGLDDSPLANDLKMNITLNTHLAKKHNQ
ncbi:MAG: tetratricopeptide repeat protein [Candidatus Hermodarchaeota archaeon]